MQTTTKSPVKQNTVLVHFNDGQRHKFTTAETHPQIRTKFEIGRAFYIKGEENLITVEAFTIL
jgi:hypothetical protein